MVEHSTADREVPGSNPDAPFIIFCHFFHFFVVFFSTVESFSQSPLPHTAFSFSQPTPVIRISTYHSLCNYKNSTMLIVTLLGCELSYEECIHVPYISPFRFAVRARRLNTTDEECPPQFELSLSKNTHASFSLLLPSSSSRHLSPSLL